MDHQKTGYSYDYAGAHYVAIYLKGRNYVAEDYILSRSRALPVNVTAPHNRN